MIVEPWQTLDWRYTYIPTIQGREKRPVIYVVAPLSAGNSFGGFGGMGGGFGGGLPPFR